ncbi:hypothetical protein Ddc_10095 [Ditylenchus destructor]|nr:hypothetical protein Ddc_10095 [Ditylenchus destructor]
MSCSKPLPPFTFDLLCYLNRDQLERFSFVCRSLKNIIERYFNSKPCRIFDELRICGGLYALWHNKIKWRPNHDDDSVERFLAGQKERAYYSFAEMHPYLGPDVRIKLTTIYVAKGITYNPEHIAEIESMAYLWSDFQISIRPDMITGGFSVENLQPILDSQTILQCQTLDLSKAHFAFKDYKLLYTVKVIQICPLRDIDLNYWSEYLEEPGVKPIVVIRSCKSATIVNLLDRLSKAFSSALLPNAFKIVFTRRRKQLLTEFRETNTTSGEKLELKKGRPVEYQHEEEKTTYYTLERSSI